MPKITISSNLLMRKLRIDDGQDNNGGGNENTGPYPYSVLNLEYVNSLSVSIFENASEGLSAKPDGTRMYVYGLSGNDVTQFNLSEPWNYCYSKRKLSCI